MQSTNHAQVAKTLNFETCPRIQVASNPMHRFYDCHFHVLNLSHPNILAFLGRVDLRIVMLAGSLIGPLVTFFAGQRIKRILNLLSVMENDAANLFLMLEYSLRHWTTAQGRPPLARDGKLMIGETPYDRLVLLPLLIDFGCKNIRAGSFYRIPPQKPIVEQVVDLFHGIATYTRQELADGPAGHPEKAARQTPPLFEIFPFVGINTKNYTLEEVDALLQKYFSDYAGRIADLLVKQGAFDGDIDAMRSGYFAGVKLYPPLGFDPWPDGESASDHVEREKVAHLYRFCSERGIPLIAHCSDGGFIVDKKHLGLSTPERWRPVLEAFPALKLCLAHLGEQRDRRLGLFKSRAWRKALFALIDAHENVYTDISCCAFDDGFYEELKLELDRQKPKVAKRILFGSDFIVNLLWSDSYGDYLTHFGDTAHLTSNRRALFCHQNPERFLFHCKGNAFIDG